MSNISFDNAYLLLIAVPLVILFTVPFLIAVRKDNRNAHNVTSQILHVVMALIIAFAAAGTSITAVLTETDVYVVADVSYSASKNLDNVDSYIRGIKLPRNAKMGLVCFGKDYKLVSELGDKNKIASVKNSGVDETETNIAEALNYAGTLFEEDVIKRIVLITDGKQTDEADTYAIHRAINALQARDIKVDAIYLDDNLSEDAREVQISSVDYTRSVFIDHSETATVYVQSSYETDAILTLYKGDTKLSDRAIRLMDGATPVTFDLDTSEAGSFDYRVTVSVGEDASDHNNEVAFTQIVSPIKRILLITGNWNDCPEIIEQYGDSGAYIDVYEKEFSGDTDHTPTPISVKRAYKAQFEGNERININLMSDVNLDIVQPWSIEQLCKYDEIIISDIDITALPNRTEFVSNLNTAVSFFGKSLLTFGNLHIQNSGIEELEELGEMLPVRYGRSDNLPKLFTLVVDSSRSMTTMGNLQKAKSSAIKLLDLMGDNDFVNLVSFDENAHIRLNQSPAKRRDDIINAINSLSPVQGTDIKTALSAAYDLCDDPYQRFSERRVVFISDGINYVDDSDSVITSVASSAYDDGVVTTVLDMGRQRNPSSDQTTVSSKAERLLKAIAAAGGGSVDDAYLYLGDTEDLPDDVFQQISDKMYETVVERTTSVNITRRSDEVLEGLPQSGLPDITGYIYSSSKPNATNVLELNHKKQNSDEFEKIPLYAYWSRTNGKVASFTSALSRDWLTQWDDSELSGQFISNILDVNTPEQKTDYPYVFDVLQDGSLTTVKVAPATLRFTSTANISITLPDGTVSENVMVFDGAEYSYEFTAVDVGKYTITVSYEYNGTQYTAISPLTVSYKSEYNEFTLYEPSVLSKAIGDGGQLSLDGSLSLENAPNEAGTYTVELTMPLLIICAVLYVVDIIIRKLKWEDIKSFFASFGKSRKEEGGNS